MALHTRDDLIATGYGGWAGHVLRGALEGSSRVAFDDTEIPTLVAEWLSTPQLPSGPPELEGLRVVMLPIDEDPTDGDVLVRQAGAWVASPGSLFFGSLGFRGAWAPNTEYKAGQLVIAPGAAGAKLQGRLLAAVADFTSGSAFAAVNWTLAEHDENFTGPFAVNTHYTIGQVASYLGMLYQANATFDSVGAFSPSDWTALGGAVSSVAGRAGAVSLTKADVGLSSVDNTPDDAKPVSAAQATAIALRAADTAVVHNTGDESIAGVKVFTSPGTFNLTGVPLTLIGGGGGNPVQQWIDKTTGRTLATMTNISAGGYAGSLNLFGTNCIGGADATGALLGWQAAIDQAAPIADRDYVPVVKVRRSTLTGVVTTAGGAAITAPVGTFDLLNDAGLLISSPNIPTQILAGVTDSSHATLTTGAGVTAGHADAVLNGARDMEYWFHNGTGPPQVGFFPRAYVAPQSTLADGVVSGGTSLASATAVFTAGVVGSTITVAGVANRIAAFTDANHVTLANATANGAGVTFTYYSSITPPTAASTHFGGSFGNANDRQQIELIPGVSQIAPTFGVRRLGEAQPVMTWALSGGVAAALIAPAMSLGTGGGVWGVGGGTAPDLVVGRASPGPAWTIQRAAAGLTQLLCVQNPQAADGAGARVAYSADTFIFGALDFTNTTFASGAATFSLKVGSGGGKGTIIEKLQANGNGVAVNAKTPFFPNTTPTNATAVATTASSNAAPWGYTTQAQADAIVTTINQLVAAINFWNTNLKAEGWST